MVMLHKLGVTVRIRYNLPVFFIVVQKGETWMVPGSFAMLQMPHQGIDPVVPDGHKQWVDHLELAGTKRQDLYSPIIGGRKPGNILVDGITRDALYGGYPPVAETATVSDENLFYVDWIKYEDPISFRG